MGTLKLLLNPWLLVGIGAACVGSFFYGVYLEHGRYMAFVAKVEAEGEAAARRSAERVAHDKKLLKETEEQHERNEKDLRARLGALDRTVVRLRDQARTRRSIVPAAPKAAGESPQDSDRRICFDREKLREGIDRSLERFGGSLARFAERFGESARRGSEALNDLNTCARWAQGTYSPL